MESIIFLIIVTIIVVVLCFLFVAIAPYLIIGAAILWVISWVYNKFFRKDEPENMYENPFNYEEQIDDNMYQNTYSHPSNPDVIDVEYTEHEDDSND